MNVKKEDHTNKYVISNCCTNCHLIFVNCEINVEHSKQGKLV